MFIHSGPESIKHVHSFYSSWNLQSFQVSEMAAVYSAWECILQVMLYYPIAVRDSAVILMIKKIDLKIYLKKPPTQPKTQYKTKLLFIT